MRSWVLLTVIAVALAQVMSAQHMEMPTSPTLWANCSPSNPRKNVAVAGPSLRAKNGDYRAWVQVSSVASPQGRCLNTTILWVSKGGLHPFLPRFTQYPVYPNLEGNGMEIIDWSADGELLLTELRRWNTEPNDAPIERRILVFEPRANKKFEIDLDRLTADQKGRDCWVRFNLLGFTPDNAVALKAEITTFYEVDESPDTKAANKMCREKTELLAIDPHSQSRRVLTADFSAERYSFVEADLKAAAPSRH